MLRQIATFHLQGMMLGVDILLVREVYRKISLTPIPDSSKHLRGLVNLRGRVVTVIDLNVCLQRDPIKDIKNSRLLIMKTDEEVSSYLNDGSLKKANLGDDIVGFLIDRMDDVLELEDKQIHPPPPNMKISDETLVEGVIKQENELIILLDVSAILDNVINMATDIQK